jgi:adenylosuccinate synthase
VANIKVVVGSNFGDEGKGLMTDYFCHQATSKGENCIVVMSNGGSQRGHTVVDADGTRHVFKHFGSGTLTGADTYCADDFILNPMTFCKEYDELQLKYLPHIYVHPNCKWTTPYDMFINQIGRHREY